MNFQKAAFAISLTSVAILSIGASSNTAHAQQPSAGGTTGCHELDYFVGEWVVSGGNSELADVKWEAPAGGCYLLETWKFRQPGPVKVYFALLAYDVTLKNWSYLAASAEGIRLRFENGIVDGDTINFEQADVNGGARHQFGYRKVSRDSLREFSFRSTDGGKTWQQEYDLAWQRIK